MVRLQAPLEAVQRRVEPTAGQLVADGDDVCVITAGTGSLEAVAAHQAWPGVLSSVVSPPQLRAAVHPLGRRTVASADAG
ncbi:hypothetical protein FHN55_11600 [Streptomyces sp. NP160]|uniref:hypothetical protein n=1 Tax=Streptomyces sp. NP160 TaxID=2586637 RepID=UPI0011197B16|nr:hypothetical protein [Streptomyces sp. NP160]TNM67148.1 hypothetical protein FHN55_11600 [Streptomyces sp. NP160]